MKVADLPPEVLERLKQQRFDRFVEKHEEPFTWEWFIGESEFLDVDGYQVLLPLDEEQRPNVTVLKCFASAAARTLTVFLKDTTNVNEDRPDQLFFAGFMAVCRKFPDENFFTSIVYHEWMLLEETLI
ncbi:MAG: hypothetical protein ACRD9R_07380 [Pyrinomonadaceae bacterium]